MKNCIANRYEHFKKFNNILNILIFLYIPLKYFYSILTLFRMFYNPLKSFRTFKNNFKFINIDLRLFKINIIFFIYKNVLVYSRKYQKYIDEKHTTLGERNQCFSTHIKKHTRETFLQCSKFDRDIIGKLYRSSYMAKLIEITRFVDIKAKSHLSGTIYLHIVKESYSNIHNV